MALPPMATCDAAVAKRARDVRIRPRRRRPRRRRPTRVAADTFRAKVLTAFRAAVPTAHATICVPSIAPPAENLTVVIDAASHRIISHIEKARRATTTRSPVVLMDRAVRAGAAGAVDGLGALAFTTAPALVSAAVGAACGPCLTVRMRSA